MSRGGDHDILAGLDPVELAVALSQRPPTDALVAAARLAVEQADARWERDRALGDAAKDACRAMKDEGRSLPDPREERRVWEARAQVDGSDSYAARKAAGYSELDDPERAAAVAERQREWARHEAEMVDRANRLAEYRAQRDGTEPPPPLERDTTWDGPGRQRTAEEEEQSRDRTEGLVAEAEQGTDRIIEEARQYVADRDADQARYEREAFERAWRAEDHRDAIRELEDAHRDTGSETGSDSGSDDGADDDARERS